LFYTFRPYQLFLIPVHLHLRNILPAVLKLFNMITYPPQQLPIRTGEGLSFFNLCDIVRFEASSNYTCIHFINRRPVLTAKLLAAYEHLLSAAGFVRTHRSHLVNRHCIVLVDRKGGLLLTDRSIVEVSRRRRKEVMQCLKRAA
jgi:two-component system LytT family response regulator